MHTVRRNISLLVAFSSFLLLPSLQAQDGCVSIAKFGGRGDGVTNNVTALRAAIAALPSNGGCILFPAGDFRFAAIVAIPFPAHRYSISIRGAGADVTTLHFAASDGISVGMQLVSQSIHVQDLTFATSAEGGFAALTLKQSAALGTFAQSEVDRVTFRGEDGGALKQYWQTGIVILGLSNINFDSDLFYGNDGGKDGTGISLAGRSEGTDDGIIYNIAKSGFFSEGIGLKVVTRIQGVTVTQSNFNNGQTCVLVAPGAKDVTEIALTGGDQMNCLGTQVELAAPVASLIMTGNLIYILPGGTGVWFRAFSFQNTITGNVFSGVSPIHTTAILAGAAVTDTLVSGNAFFNLDTGINLTGAPSGWNVQGNSYQKVATRISNKGANKVGAVTD